MSEIMSVNVAEVNKLTLDDAKELEIIIATVLAKGFSAKPAFVAFMDLIRDRFLAVTTKVLEIGQLSSERASD